MRVFVTGATGFVGSAVVQDLLSAGHEVIGLARSDEGAAKIQEAGATALRGSMTDLDLLTRGAREADAVAHLAFNHDFSKFADNAADDARAIEALAAGLEGSQRPLLVTSGVALIAPGRLATETDTVSQQAAHMPRRSEGTAMALRAGGLRAATVRLAPSVHGRGDHGFVPMLIGLAREKGVSAYIDGGANRWPGVHRADAAKVYRLALEQGATEAAYHAIAEEGIAFKDIATAIGEGLGLPVVSKSGTEVEEHFGWFAMFAGMDAPASSALTRAKLGWTPKGPGLLDDITNAGYLD